MSDGGAVAHSRPRGAPPAVRALHGFTSQYVEDRWLEVFTPDAVYTRVRHAVHARAVPGAARGGAAWPVHREHARRRVRRRHRHRQAALRVHRPADPRHAPRLVPRRVRPHRRRLAHPPALDHVHAQARRVRLRDASTTRSPTPTEGAHRGRVPEDDQRRRPRRRAAARVAGPPAGEDARAGPARRAGALGRLLARRRRVVQAGDDRGRHWGDYWLYEDRLIYVHKRHVAIPLDATPDGDVRRFDRTKLAIAALTYDDMRPGCYEPKARVDDLALAGVDGSLAFPTFPRFCGQTFMEGEDLELGLECVRAYNDWMVDEWCGDSDGHLIPLCLIPMWDVDLAAAEVARNAARGARAVCFSEIPPHLGLPSIHTGYWDPLFAVCEETRTVAVHAHRLVVEDAGRVAGRAAVDRHHAVVQQLDGVARRLPLLRRARAVPRAEARVLRGPDRLDPLRARARRQRVGAPLELDEGEGDDPRAAVVLLPGPDLRVLHQRRPRAGVARARSARTTSASRPTTRTPTRRGRSRGRRPNA